MVAQEKKPLIEPIHTGGTAIMALMSSSHSRLSDWTPQQIALGRRWVVTWSLAGPELERIRRKELRSLDSAQAIALLCGPADYRVAPRAANPTSGLVEQQQWFMKAARPRD